MKNNEDRLNDVFFYGLYMDPEVLKSKQVEPRNPRIGFARGYRLRIGKMATLLRDSKSSTSGIVYSLTHQEIEILYSKSGLDMYVSEALLIKLESGETISALCCNLLSEPEENESNPEYESKLIACMERLGVPLSSL